MSNITEADFELLRELRREGVLAQVDEHRVPLDNGVILVTCGDGDRLPDIFAYKRKIVETRCNDTRIHLLAWNGGALRLAKPSGSARNSPIKTDGTGAHKLFLQEIAGAVSLKGIRTVALYIHAPCGWAGLAGIDIRKTLLCLIEAKKTIKVAMPDVQVAAFVQVDYGDFATRIRPDKRRFATYFTSRANVEQWIRKSLGVGAPPL